MTRDELATASDLLADAAEATDGDEDADRLAGLSEKLRDYATADRGPDHGSLARVENTLGELADDAGDEARELIEEAHDHVKEYRSGVAGV